MTLHLADKWVWDFWFAREGEFTHIFYLQAARQLMDADIRHWHASIGHARSRDLRDWEILPDALQPSVEVNKWDNLATWTGSVLHYAEKWYMFYTGISHAEEGLVQRIGLASSPDLVHWEKYAGNPVISIDPNCYERLDKQVWYEETWRDPWVFRWEDKFHALITARVPYGEPRSRGVVAHAVSEDLFHWKVERPITNPGEFAYLEVPQVVQIGEHWYLFFSVEKERYSQQRAARKDVCAQTGTHYMVGEHPLGPYRLLTDDFLYGDEIGSFYSGKVIQNNQGDWVLLACRQHGEKNGYIGEISDPMPIEVQADGRLTVKKFHESGGSYS
jgi:beta-fructofuranosidase